MALSHVEFYAETDAAGVTDPTLGITSVAWAAGDRIYVTASGKDDDAVVTSVTATGLTFTQLRAQDEATQQQVWIEVWESDIASSGDTQTVTVTLDANPHVGGFMAEAWVVSGDTPTTDADNGAETGASDTDTPTVDVTTVADATLLIYAFQHRNVTTVTFDGADGLTESENNNQVGTAGNIAGYSSGSKTVSSQGTYNGSLTLSAVRDWVAIGWSVYEAGGGGGGGRYLLESGSPDGYLLESGTGVLLLEGVSADTIELGLLDAAPALFAPTLAAKSQLTLGLLDGAPALYAPTIVAKNLITLGLLDAGPALYAPTLTPKNAISLGLIDGASALFAPTLTGKNLVSLGLLDAAPALYAPSLTPKNQLTIGFLDAGPGLFAPTLAVGPATITLGLLDAGADLYAPAVSQASGTLDITLGLLDAGPDLYAPTVIAAPVTITLGLLDAGPALYDPTVAQASGAQTVVLGLLDASAALYAPSLSLGGTQTVVLGLLDGAATLYAPALIGGLILTGGQPPGIGAAVHATVTGSASASAPAGSASSPAAGGSASHPTPGS